MKRLITVFVVCFISNTQCFLSTSLHTNSLRDVLPLSFELSSSTVATKSIRQPVDHFNSSDRRTFNMRYLQNLEFWKDDGPVFIFIGGEGDMNSNYLLQGYVYELANETNGALYHTEHRYYGKSLPVSIDGPDYVANLKYLSSRQALADLANFIKKQIRIKHPKSKVVIVGGSYAGNLAAWMKAVYPDLVDAAIASGAPVLAKFDFYEFLETVTSVLKRYGGNSCYDYIKNMFEHYSELLKTDEGIAIIQQQDKICTETDLTKLENQQRFMAEANFRFGSWVLYSLNEKEIAEKCQNITRNQTRLVDIHRNFQYPLQCDFESGLDNVLASRDLFNIKWNYQLCTEFGYAVTTSSNKQIFSSLITTSYMVKTCQKLFGDKFSETSIKNSVNRTNKFYNGLNPDVKYVLFVNGELDPWHRLSVVKTLSKEVPAIVIPKTSHIQDLEPNLDTDPKELQAARQNIKKIIKEWIGCD